MEIAIYTYRVWDTFTGGYVTPPRRATREFIEKVKKAEILEASEELVDEGCVDDEGQEILESSRGR
jgi:hypothetical protein